MLISYNMCSSNHFSISSRFPCFSRSRFFRVQVFPGPGFSRSRFLGSRVRVQGPGPVSGSRVQGPGPGYRSSHFSYNDPIPNDLKSFLVYKFTCASCSSSYIGKTCRHFKTRIEEHIKKDNKSHIFKYLHSSETCFDSYNSLCFKIIDKANSKFELKIKEALHIHNKII